MASKTTAPKSLKPIAAVEVTTLDEAVDTIEEAIQQVVNTFGVTVQRGRLKGIRALAYRAFVDSIEAGDFDNVVQRAIGNVDNLPTGCTVNAPKAAPKPRAKPTPEAATRQTKVQSAAASPVPPRAAPSRPPKASLSRSSATWPGSATPLDRGRPSGDRWAFCHAASEAGCRSGSATLGRSLQGPDFVRTRPLDPIARRHIQLTDQLSIILNAPSPNLAR